MSEMFGSGWVSQFGESPTQLWVDSLAQLSSADINRGLNAVLTSRAKYAPNLPIFLGYCTAPIVEDVYKQERDTYARLSAPKPERNAEVRRAAILKMKEELGVRL